MYKFLYVLLISVSVYSPSFELVILLSIIILSGLVVSNKAVISKTFYNLVSILIVLVATAFIVGLFRGYSFWNFIKDFFYLTKPILFLVIGYLTAKKFNGVTNFYKLIIYLALAFATFHIIKGLIYFSNTTTLNISGIREAIGRDNYLELFGMALMIANFKLKIFKIRFYKVIFTILLFSFVFYFSRTMFVLLFLLSMAFMGYLKISKRGLKYIFISVMAIALLYVYLFSIEIPRESKSPLDKFLYKLKLAPSEIFITKGSFDVKDHAKLWDHWRAYEVKKAVEQLEEEGLHSWVFGLGMGSTVDLDFYAPLSDDTKGMRYISLLHNGYAFVLYKIGIIGVFLYLLFLIANYVIYKSRNNEKQLISNVIFGITIFYCFSTLVISGLYNLSDPITLLLGGAIYFKEHN